MLTNGRIGERRTTDCVVELTWKSESGEQLFEECRAVDLSESGVAVECPETVPLLSNIVVRAAPFELAALAQVRHCTWRESIYVLGLLFLARTTTARNDPYAPDHYEMLRLSRGADQETIERVYRTLALRFHPDNQMTGDAEIFLRLSDAYRVLSNPKRAGGLRFRAGVGKKHPPVSVAVAGVLPWHVRGTEPPARGSLPALPAEEYQP
jgi:hypothetical protein